MNTVTFFYTDGVTYKATNVTSITKHVFSIEYTQSVMNESETVGGFNVRAVDLDDLLYAVVKNNATKEVTIIPGLYDSFDVVPKGEAVRRQENIEEEAARVAARREANAPARKAKEEAKFAKRRQARKDAYLKENPAAAEVQATPSAPKTVSEQLVAAGVSEGDIAVLRSLNVMK